MGITYGQIHIWAIFEHNQTFAWLSVKSWMRFSFPENSVPVGGTISQVLPDLPCDSCYSRHLRYHLWQLRSKPEANTSGVLLQSCKYVMPTL